MKGLVLACLGEKGLTLVLQDLSKLPPSIIILLCLISNIMADIFYLSKENLQEGKCCIFCCLRYERSRKCFLTHCWGGVMIIRCKSGAGQVEHILFLLSPLLNPFSPRPAKTVHYVILLCLTPDIILLVKGEPLGGKGLTGPTCTLTCPSLF